MSLDRQNPVPELVRLRGNLPVEDSHGTNVVQDQRGCPITKRPELSLEKPSATLRAGNPGQHGGIPKYVLEQTVYAISQVIFLLRAGFLLRGLVFSDG